MKPAVPSSKAQGEQGMRAEGLVPPDAPGLQLNWMYWRPERWRRRPGPQRPTPWFWVASPLPQHPGN